MKIAVLVSAALLTAGLAVSSAQSITDAQIAAIVVTANQVDIDAGKLAAATTANADVRSFAERMIAEHTAVNQSATDLAGRLKLTPEENPTSRSLKEAGERNLARLKAIEGAAFDTAYVDHEVTYHQQVLDALDKTLIPNAKNAELKALLEGARPAFVQHLEHAKHLRSILAKGR
jgi:putative membrane protein